MLKKKLGKKDVIGLKVRFGKFAKVAIGKPELKVEKKKDKKKK